jgi:hypothetical protein
MVKLTRGIKPQPDRLKPKAPRHMFSKQNYARPESAVLL